MCARSWIFVVLAALSGCGCSGGPDSPADASSFVDLDAGGPVAPASLVLACPEGWRPRELYEATICEPFAADEAPRCAEGEIALVGQPAGSECQPVGVCPSGPWPDDVPADAVYFRVDAAGGDGTRDAPYGMMELGDALAAARARGTLVIGEGEITTSIDVTGIGLVMGLCPARSRVRSAGHAVSVLRGTTELRGLHVEGSLRGIWIDRSTTVVRLREVIAIGGVNGIHVEAGTLDAERVLLRGPPADLVELASALAIRHGALAALRRADLAGGGGAIGAPAGDEPPTVTVEDSVIHDTAFGVSGPLLVTLRRTALERASLGLLTIAHTIALEDLRMRDIGDRLYAGGSFGLVMGGGSVTLRRVAMSRVHGYAVGVLAGDVEATLDADELFISDTSGILSPMWHDRIAMLVSGPLASATVRRAHFARIVGNAIHVEYGALVGSDIRIVDTEIPDDDDTWGHAFQAYHGHVSLERVDARPAQFGLFAIDDGAFDVTDLDLGGGLGLQVQCITDCDEASTRLSLSRASVHDLRRAALMVTNATAELADVTIATVVPQVDPIALDDLPGAGLVAVGGTIRGARVLIQDVHGIGVLSHDGGLVHLDELVMRRVQSIDCACGPSAYGDGVVWTTGAGVELGALWVEHAARGGLVAGYAAGPFTVEGTVQDCGIGIITDPRTDVRHTDFGRVRYGQNAIPTIDAEVSIGESETTPWRYAPASFADPRSVGF